MYLPSHALNLPYMASISSLVLHTIAGYAVQNGAVTVDVSNLTSFTVNTAAGPLNNTVTFGAGLRLGQLYLKMYLEANSMFPAGVCPWVGTAGHILGE